MKIFIQTSLKDTKKIGNYSISHMSYDSFLDNKRKLLDYIKSGLSSSTLFNKLRNPEYIQKLYLEKDKHYFNFLNSFKDKYQDFDVIVMNPGVDLVHPEFLYQNFPNAIKCLHFIDDPHGTYSYGLPFAWAFDCATYISPSYNEHFSMSEILKLAGFKKTKWVPLCNSNVLEPPHELEQFEEQQSSRNNKIVYVGGYYSGKNKRLINLKNIFKKDFDIFGRFPLHGLSFPLDSFSEGKPQFYRVKEITDKQKEKIYSTYSIGLNMHLSEPSRETGNARLYELAYRGVAQVVDSSDSSLVREIFEPDKEILLYENLDQCIKQINKLRTDRKFRTYIALNAYKRAIREYNYPNNLLKLFDWFKLIKSEHGN